MRLVGHLLTGNISKTIMRHAFIRKGIQHCGVIAQLGERLHGMQEVRGSIPRSSTKFCSKQTKSDFGVIAQLGERLHGMQEVRGSIPRSSTK